MRIRAVCLLLAALMLSACGGGGLFKAYEYEEDMYLALDGTATLYVNSSVAALNALRGTSFDTDPSVTPSRDAIRALYGSPNTEVTRITFSRRSNRRFVHVRIDVADVTKLGAQAPFSWSTYRFARNGELFDFRQTVGASADKPVPDAGWDGDEIVAFRLHLPSKIAYHNAGPGNPHRGNILAWEQSLAERRRGVPLMLDARMETQSILYRTLALFAATAVAVAIGFALLIWWMLRRARKPAQV